MADKKQKLELTWIGKDEELKLEPRILIEDPSKSYGDKSAENMLIHGDNLLALKALEQDFAGRIKCIYIDPPYNTGSAFEHYDDNLEHSIWLNLMKSRLEILKRLLHPKEGTIWISLDDSEHAYLKVLMDEIFGRDNFVSNITVIVKTEGRRYGNLAKTHEYILCYARSINDCELNQLRVEGKKFQFKDSLGGFDLTDLRNQNNRAFNAGNRPNLRYPFFVDKLSKDSNELMTVYINKKSDDLSDDLVEVWPIETNGFKSVWRWGKEKAENERLSNLTAREGSDGVIRIFQKYRSETMMAKTVWFEKELITNKGTKESQALFGDASFNFPKPEALAHKILNLATSEGDFVLDSFIGSGTTAAVAHKINRKWIGVELGEHANTHCVPRLKQIIDGNDQGGITKLVEWKGGGGFKFYNLAPSLLCKDSFGNFVIDEKYNSNMLAAAMCKHEGFKFYPAEGLYWKHGKSTENDFIFVTTGFVAAKHLEKIKSEMKAGESLLICAKSFAPECENLFADITIKKIPQMILGKCEFGKDNYDLNIIKATEEAGESNEE